MLVNQRLILIKSAKESNDYKRFLFWKRILPKTKWLAEHKNLKMTYEIRMNKKRLESLHSLQNKYNNNIRFPIRIRPGLTGAIHRICSFRLIFLCERAAIVVPSSNTCVMCTAQYLCDAMNRNKNGVRKHSFHSHFPHRLAQNMEHVPSIQHQSCFIYPTFSPHFLLKTHRAQQIQTSVRIPTA